MNHDFQNSGIPDDSIKPGTALGLPPRGYGGNVPRPPSGEARGGPLRLALSCGFFLGGLLLLELLRDVFLELALLLHPLMVQTPLLGKELHGYKDPIHEGLADLLILLLHLNVDRLALLVRSVAFLFPNIFIALG